MPARKAKIANYTAVLLPVNTAGTVLMPVEDALTVHVAAETDTAAYAAAQIKVAEGSQWPDPIDWAVVFLTRGTHTNVA
jgi:hypothetical protein